MLLTIIKKHENVFFSCKLSLKNYLPQNEDAGLDRLIIEIFFYFWYMYVQNSKMR